MKLKCTLAAAACALVFAACSHKEESASPAGPPGPSQLVNPSLAMIGYVDVPADGAKVRGQFGVGGWALWGQGVQGIELLLDGSPVGAAVQIGVARPDVAQAHPEYHDPNSGWGTALNTANLPAGEHKLTVRVRSRGGAAQDLQTLTLGIAKP